MISPCGGHCVWEIRRQYNLGGKGEQLGEQFNLEGEGDIVHESQDTVVIKDRRRQSSLELDGPLQIEPIDAMYNFLSP